MASLNRGLLLCVALPVLWLSSVSVWAASQSRPVLGPERFFPLTQPRAIYVRPFDVPAFVLAPYSLEIVNGLGASPNRNAVRMGQVRLDGVVIVPYYDPSWRAPLIRRTLSLTPGAHRLELSLVGLVGSYIRLTISGTIRIGDLSERRSVHSATLLSDGQVLLAGGEGNAGRAELFDPATLRSRALPSGLLGERFDHAATLLPQGHVLITGGEDDAGVLSSSELFDPVLEVFSLLPASMQRPRTGHTATLLLDGRVLILGGLDASYSPLSQVEAFDPNPDPLSGVLYDPQLGVFTPLPHALLVRRVYHTATLLPSGEVLVVGGSNGRSDLASAELFDPASERSRLLGARLTNVRGSHTATLRPDGKVLIAGGAHGATILRSLELYDPARETFTAVSGSLQIARYNHTATLLPTGEILIAGGTSATEGRLADTELVGPPPPDTLPPRVVAAVPAPGAVGVELNRIVGIRFSEPLSASSVTASTVRLSTGGEGVVGSVSSGESGLYAFFVPEAPLEPGRSYLVELEGAQDLSGRALAPSSWTFSTFLAPLITGFDPSHGLVGTLVTITGENFDPVPAGNLVTIGLASAAVDAASATSLTITVPPESSAGLQRVAVRTRGGRAEAAEDFSVENPVPILDSIDPSEAPAGSGALTLTLRGSSFADAATASFGGTGLVTTRTSASELRAEIPAAALATCGSFGVTVTNPGPGGGSSSAIPFAVRSVGTTRGLRVTPAHAYVATGGTQQFTATAYNSDDTSCAVTAVASWTSSNLAVATVSASGVATGVSPGTATLTASFDFAASAEIRVFDAGPLPPDPATVAPTLDRTVATTLVAAADFLYSGSYPIQTGVGPGVISPVRIAVLRGVVKARDGSPLSGVAIRVLGHPELGGTLSRADGAFDMAVNGGGVLSVVYEKAGFPPVQRQAQVAWQDYSVLPDVVMIPYDTRVTAIDLSAAIPIQVARGSVVSDADGTRQATLLFPQGTTAEMSLPGGGNQPLTTLSLRATEYSVGASGPDAMPAPLPPASGYTYAVELSADEAVAGGVKVAGRDVRLSQSVPFYVENFLNLPVGGGVPVGYYDNDRGSWVPYDNGRIVKLLSVTGGLADLDVDGSNQPASPAALAALGITDAERAELATLYAPGVSLWRVALSHLSTWDCNWPYREPDEAEGASGEPEGEEEEDKGDCVESSVIECQNQTLGEAIGVTGTPFSLHYRSSRTAGRKSASTLKIPLSGASVPASLKRIQFEILIAGRRIARTFATAPDQEFSFTWDGKDAYGRTLQGSQPVTTRVGYVYDAVYQEPGPGNRSFSEPGGPRLTGDTARQEITIWQERSRSIGAWDAQAQGLGGWSLNVQHAYDPSGRVLYLGDGTRRSAAGLPNVIGTTAGSGGSGFGTGIASGPDGSLYFSDNSRIRRLGPDGIVTTVAGGGATTGDGGPATAAQLGAPYGIAVGPDASLYIAELSGHRIRRVDPDGIITTVAGTGTAGFSGDAGPATSAQLDKPWGVAVGPDGGLYIGDARNHRVRRVAPDGVITTVAGTGTPGFSGDAGPATSAQVYFPTGLAFGPGGELYVSDSVNNRVRKVSRDGVITTFAGNGLLETGGEVGDGGPATSANLNQPYGLAVAPDGTLYIADSEHFRIRRVAGDGIITTLAGNGSGGTAINGSIAAAAPVYSYAVTLAPDRALYLPDFFSDRVLRVGSGLPAFSASDILVASEDGGEVYAFDAEGRHQRTLNALTGAVALSFGYDSGGRLTTVTDGDGNVTTIERGGATPTAMVAPGGQRTTLATEGGGYLGSVTDPGGNATRMTYSSDGLLATYTDPNGNVHPMTYDTLGRLTKDENPAGGFWALARTDSATGHTNTLTSALGRTQSYQVETLATGGRRTVNTDASGLQTTTVIGADGTRTVTAPDGTVTTLIQGPDPRWGMQAPLVAALTRRTPGGVTSTVGSTRTAALSSATDPLSLQSLTETFTLNGRTYTSVFDAASRALTTTAPSGRQKISVLDARGRVVELRWPGLLPIFTTYDGRGRLSAITQGSRVVGVTYDAQNRPITMTDSLSRTVSFEHDTADRVTKQTLPGAREVWFGYDGNSNITSITPPGRPAHSFGYTAVDLEASYTRPDVGAGTDATVHAYNADKRRMRITRPDGAVVDFGYDGAGRLSTLTSPRGPTTYGYDPATGDLATVTAPDGESVSYAHDGSLPLSSTWSGELSGSVSRTFDNDLRVSSESVNGAHTVSYGYDSDGLLTQAGDVAITRDTQNGLITGTTLGSVTDSYQYDGFGEVSRYTASFGAAPLLDLQYVRDDLGRITQKTETTDDGITRVFGYDYDLAGRLTTVSRNGDVIASYTYDSNGNRLSTSGERGSFSGTYDDRDRVLSYGGASYAYSSAGELRTKTEAGETTTYDHDARGILTGVSLPGGTRVDYKIDGQNRRIGKKVDGVLVQRWLYGNRLQVVAELDAGGSVVSRFVYGSSVTVPGYVVKGGSTYRILTDHLGSVRLVVEATTGTILQRMDYDEFGNVTQDTNPGFQPFAFIGREIDLETGLCYFRARYYDPKVGRFLSEDPIGFQAGVNFYSYVNNRPTFLSDPFGLDAITKGPFTYYYNQGDMTPTEITAERAHEARHRGDFWNGRQFTDTCEVLEARGFAEEIPIWQERIKELSSKTCSTGAEKDELVEAKDKLRTVTELSDPTGSGIKAYCHSR